MSPRGFLSIDTVRRRVLACLLGSIWLSVLGCGLMQLPRVDPSQPVELSPDEGLLIIQIDTDAPLSNLFLNSRSVVRSLKPGRHIWITRVKAGAYRWSRVDFPAPGPIGSGQIIVIEPLQIRLDPEDDLMFNVKPGVINYPGEVVIRAGRFLYTFSAPWSLESRNHSARAIRQLKPSYESILQSFPLEYVGNEEDP